LSSQVKVKQKQRHAQYTMLVATTSKHLFFGKEARETKAVIEPKYEQKEGVVVDNPFPRGESAKNPSKSR
jgi:hypothetical protein